MNARKTELQLPLDGAAPDDAARADEDDAPPQQTEEGTRGQGDKERDATPAAPSSPLPLVPSSSLEGPSAWQDFPVASVLPPVAPLLPPTPALAPLEDRLRRLESELVQLRTLPPAGANVVRRAADPAAGVVRPPARFWSNLGGLLTAPSGPSAAPPPRAESFASMVPPGVRRTWLILDALGELRAIYWMFFDPRYRLSWVARLAPLVVLALILTSGFWMPATSIPILGTIFIDKVVDLILAYLLFKLLSYEARRYRETAPDLPPSLRQ